MRTVPEAASVSAEAARAKASAAAAMVSAWAPSSRAASVGDRPLGERVKSATPIERSSASRRRRTVG